MKKFMTFLTVLVLGIGFVFFCRENLDWELLKEPLTLDDIVWAPDGTHHFTHSESGHRTDGDDESAKTGFSGKTGNRENCDGNFEYAFSCLSGEEKTVYDEILVSLQNCERESALSTMDRDLIDRMFRCVMMDHPELFYVDGYKCTTYSRGDILSKMTFSGNLIYDKSEVKRRRKEIDAVVDEIVSKAPDTADDYLLVRYAFDTVVSMTDYELHSADSQNICSVFLNHKSVCCGYSKAFQYLLLKLNVPSTYVEGRVAWEDTELHAWNMVRMNGKWYYMDVTAGDGQIGDGFSTSEMRERGFINYDYFGVTTEELMKSYRPDMPVELPVCTAIDDNYFVRENAYFYSFDEGRLQDLFDRAYREGSPVVMFKCNDENVYRNMYLQLLGKNRIFDFVQGSPKTVYHVENEDCRSFLFWL